MTLIAIEHAVKSFGGNRVIDDLSLDVAPGEFLALLGPSGCGKTTLLRSIAGLDVLDAGRIRIGGRDVTDEPPYRRPVNMVFQSYALFPHLDVTGNVGFGLRQEGLAREDIARRVGEVLALVRLEGLETRKPEQLSGGQQQRVALARALVKRPSALLLDEPLAALDRKLREGTRRELVALQRRLGMTFIMVTHDQDEALATASRLAVMGQGRILQLGSAAEVYESPASRWIARFIGEVNVLETVALEGGRLRCENLGLDLVDGSGTAPPAGTRVGFALRPERIVMDGASLPNTVEAKVAERSYLGDRIVVRAQVINGGMLTVSLPNQGVGGPEIGTTLRLGWPADAMTALEA